VYIAGYGRKGNVTRGHNCIVDCDVVTFLVRSNSGYCTDRFAVHRNSGVLRTSLCRSP
jgi:hypothetical protein